MRYWLRACLTAPLLFACLASPGGAAASDPPKLLPALPAQPAPAEPPPAEAKGREAAAAVIGLSRGWDDNVFSDVTPLRSGFSEIALDFSERVDWDELSFGSQGRGSVKIFDRSGLNPEVVGAVELFAERTFFERLVLRGSIEADSKREIDERSQRIAAVFRAGYRIGDGEIFSRTEIGEVLLNEPNLFFNFDFLPQDEKTRQLAQTFGYEIVLSPQARLGASALGVETRTPNGPDYLGLRRDNRRAQGNFLFTLAGGPFALDGSVSYARTYWPDKDFRPLHTLLYDVTARAEQGPFAATLNVRREIVDTTFPFASVLLKREIGGRLDVRLPYRNANVGGFATRIDDRLVGIELTGARIEYGLDGRFDLTTATALTGAVKRTRFLGAGLGLPDKTVVSAGLLYRLR